MGTLTINTTAGEDTRFALAVQKSLNLGSPATPAQCKAFAITMLTEYVKQSEFVTAQNAIVLTSFTPT